MKKKILFIIGVLALIVLFPLVSCENKESEHTHIYEDSVVDPTYETGGYTLHTCSVCGYSYKDTYTDVLLKTYNITYNLDGGTNNNSNPASYNKETDTICLKDPTKTGYAFTGWTTDTITTPTKNLTIEKGSVGDKVFTANWQRLYSYTDSTKTSLYFGAYPQTKVSDDSIMTSLNNLAGTLPTSTNTYLWTDYGYYIEGSISSYMYYIDIDYDNNGDYDYRGVYFTENRPYYTYQAVGNTVKTNSQLENGYNRNIVYWFKYEPIKWNLLKTLDNKALIISDLVLDSQDYYYNPIPRSSATDYQGSSTTSTTNANNYMYSHIRSWLNQTFYDTAFSTLEKQIIEITTVDNSATENVAGSNYSAGDNTNDYMFLLSFEETNSYYTTESTMTAQGSDYAKTQGLYVDASSGNSYYWLRTPNYYNTATAYNVHYASGIGVSSVYISSYGVRAACWINL